MNCLNQNQKTRINELFEKGINFLKSIKPNEKVAIIYHKDLDGLCSGVLIKIGLERLGKKVSAIIPASYSTIKDSVENLKFDKLIIVDIGTSMEFEEFFNKPTLIIDHHLIKKDLNNDNIVFINPRFENPNLYQPASYVTYRLLSKFVDLKDKEWIAVVGIVGDYGFEDCKDLIEKWVDAKSRDELLDNTKFGKAAFMITGVLFEIGFEKPMELLANSKNIEDVISNDELRSASERYKSLYDKETDNFWRNSENVDNIIFSELKPRYKGMGSNIVSEISRKNPDKMIILFEDIGDKYDIDARHQEGSVHLGKLLEKTCGGGGHRQAAGGMIDKSDLEDFKKRLIEEVHKN